MSRSRTSQGQSGEVSLRALLPVTHDLLPAAILNPAVAWVAHARRQAFVQYNCSLFDLSQDAILQGLFGHGVGSVAVACDAPCVADRRSEQIVGLHDLRLIQFIQLSAERGQSANLVTQSVLDV